MSANRSARLAFSLLTAGTVVGLAGIDLILPAIPGLPEALGGSLSKGQLVLAAFVAGTAVGLLLFGALGVRFGRYWALLVALAALALSSVACALAPTVDWLIAFRFLQGIASSAPAVFIGGVIRASYDEVAATKAFGLFGSIESIVPAVAPLVGVWLLGLGGWTLSFWLIAVLALALVLVALAMGDLFPPPSAAAGNGGFVRLLKSPTYLRYAVSHAFVLGGLLVFVLGAPTVIVRTLDGSLYDFIIMQFLGIACFIAAANLTGLLVDRFGAERMITFGSAMAAVSALMLLGYAAIGGRNIWVITFLFVPMNTGLGLRGPPGFLRAVIAGDGDDDRATSLAVLAITLATAGGTALLAPFIEEGLSALCLTVAVMQVAAVLVLAFLPPMADR